MAPTDAPGQATCERVLALVGGRADAALVTCTTGTSSLTRFANSRIHQNVSEELAAVGLTVALADGRVAQASSTRTGPDELAALVERAVAAAELAPPDPDFAGFADGGDQPPVEHFDEGTAAATAEDRAHVVAAFVTAAGELEAAGYCSTEAHTLVLATSTGVQRAARSSTAQLDGVHRVLGSAHPADGYAQATSVRLADLDGVACGAVAASKARSGVDPVELPPGDYEVVLEPRAVANALLFPAYLGFNGKAHADGTSFVHLGEPQWADEVEIWDDATDPRALGVPFDAEGTAKGRVELVRAGRSVGLVHDRRSARLAGTTSTGHSVGSPSFGAFPANLFLGGGTASPAELVAGVGRGLLVTDLWYNRILDPKTQVVTGLTRNGLFLVEDGRIAGPVQNLRYTQSIVAGFGPGRVRGLAGDAQLVSNEGGVAHVPTVHLASWSFTGNARG
ncbi:MAG: TldD/PmbA family protein [Acidimicrobiia bacterium]